MYKEALALPCRRKPAPPDLPEASVWCFSTLRRPRVPGGSRVFAMAGVFATVYPMCSYLVTVGAGAPLLGQYTASTDHNADAICLQQGRCSKVL